MSTDGSRQLYVVGGGPGGLAAAAELRRRGLRPVVLERGEQVGTSWRAGYDRLHLHTVRGLSGLPGTGIPRKAGRWPSRDAVIDYLERYQAGHELEVRGRTEVKRIAAAGPEDGDGTRWVIHTTDGGRLTARSVVVAPPRSQAVQKWRGSKVPVVLLAMSFSFTPRCQLKMTGRTSAAIGWSGCIAPMKVETQISPPSFVE